MRKSKKVAEPTIEWVKNYIGHGKNIEKLPNGVEISICIEDSEPHIFEYLGKKYLKFTVVPRKVADQYGRTHTAYISAKA